ncbi:MAG: hypothetical protein CBD18_07785 [Opitutales bacterium TMED158]|nr:MAG: hypothetical protein CBD18_07785 [Opitutales bacterium TMED158]
METLESKLDGDEDVQILGDSRYTLVRSDDVDERDWMAGSPVCRLLQQHHIAHAGILRARYPFEVVRADQSGSYMMACFGGEGQVLVDGVWKTIRQGEACLLPPFVRNAFRCISGSDWSFCWARYLESRERKPIVSQNSPVLRRYDPTPLKAAIEGLHAEAMGTANPGVLGHWVELTHQYALRFAQPHDSDDRLWRLWNAVEPELERKWSLCELAGIAHVSEEHLRRLCRTRYGRSPMQHLTFLRIQRAKNLLSTTDEKIETIARMVGYENPFTFSTLFKKWVGWSPSRYR